MTSAALRGRVVPLVVLGRLAVGGGALVAPHRTARVFGIDAAASPAAVYVGRLFGIRALMMAFLVATTTGFERDRQLRLGVAVDLVDAAAAIAAARRRELETTTATAAFAAAVTEATLGIIATRT